MDLLVHAWLGTPLWFWLAFMGLVILLTAFDLGVLHREDREISIAESLMLTAFYVLVALLFGAWVWAEKGPDLGIKYLTGFFIEKALSIDNVFVISLIFSYFAIPRIYQYRALVWGILAVIILRGLMIGIGAAVVQQWHWVLYLFAAFLMVTGFKMLFASERPVDVGSNRMVQFVARRLRITPVLHGHSFFVKVPDPESGRRVLSATPLFLALVIINLADLVFAVDSVPAVFAITTDTFVVYTSNIMAILGLRALYFALAAMVHRFAYLKYALALILVFIGAKVFAADFLLGEEKFPPVLSLAVTFALILGGILFSLWQTPRGEKRRRPEHA
jgi:tellurite resistance protein TerC